MGVVDAIFVGAGGLEGRGRLAFGGVWEGVNLSRPR